MSFGSSTPGGSTDFGGESGTSGFNDFDNHKNDSYNNMFSNLELPNTPLDSNQRAVKPLDRVKQALYQANAPFRAKIKTPLGNIPIGELVGMPLTGPMRLAGAGMVALGALLGTENITAEEFTALTKENPNSKGDHDLASSLAYGVQERALSQEEAQTLYDANNQASLDADAKDKAYRMSMARARAGASGVGMGGTVNSYLSELSNARIDDMSEGFWGNSAYRSYE